MIFIEIIVKTWFDKVNGNTYNAKQLFINDKLAINQLHQYGSFDYELIEDLKQKMAIPLNCYGHKDKLRIVVNKSEGLKRDLKFNEDSIIDDSIDYFDLELQLLEMTHVKLAKKLSVTRHTVDNWSKRGKRPTKYNGQMQALINEVLR